MLARRYNVPVFAPQAQKTPPDRKSAKRSIYATETMGLLLIACLLLVVILVRYWHAIHWSAR